MSDEQVTFIPPEGATEATEQVVETPEPPKPTAPPIRSRFLFVDVAAQRAKQLRRGARPRINGPDAFHKLERVAMKEVSEGYVDWNLPPYKGAPGEGTP